MPLFLTSFAFILYNSISFLKVTKDENVNVEGKSASEESQEAQESADKLTDIEAVNTEREKLEVSVVTEIARPDFEPKISPLSSPLQTVSSVEVTKEISPVPFSLISGQQNQPLDAESEMDEVEDEENDVELHGKNKKEEKKDEDLVIILNYFIYKSVHIYIFFHSI